MYGVKWDKKTRGIKLITSGDGDISPLIRPVFHEELDLLEFNRYWKYPKSKEPLLWNVGRYYFHDGEKVARVKGGGFYENPQLEVFEDNLELEPVDIEKMIRKNRGIMENVVHTTLDFISEIYSEYINRIDKVVVAFSGGKDSAVLLDLVQRVLAPDEYIVMFNDTTMELSHTYKFVEIIKERYPNLNFYTARYEKPAIEMWREVGIPSRIHRWCCTIYKTVPTIKAIQMLVNKETPRVLLYDGIRADESPSRAKLSRISRGKHLQQINVHPILDWNSAIVYLYTFMRDLPINKIYRYGALRVGCAVCPFESKWWEAIIWLKFRDEIGHYLNLIENYALNRKIGREDLKYFIRNGDWKARVGGREIQKKDKVFLFRKNKCTVIIIDNPNKSFLEWIKILGDTIVHNDNLTLRFKNSLYNFEFKYHKNKFEIIFKNGKLNDSILNLIKTIASKSAYCLGCKACEIECPTGAISFYNNILRVRQEKCIHCYKCLTFTYRGCLVADSRKVDAKVRGMKGFGKYKHFGIRKKWLEEFFSDPEKWWVENSLGPIQLEAMRLWLIDAEIIAVKKNKEHVLTETGKILKEIGTSDIFTWAVIWTNLAKNSSLVSWYVSELEWGRTYSREELISLMGDKLSKSTKNNGLLSLAEIFNHTPIGSDLEVGIVHRKGRAITKIEKKGLIYEKEIKIDPIIILYSLYRLSEKENRYYYSISYLYNDSFKEGPFKLFGISKEALEPVLTGLQESYGRNWMSVELAADLDNISLNPDKKSLDVLKLHTVSN